MVGIWIRRNLEHVKNHEEHIKQQPDKQPAEAASTNDQLVKMKKVLQRVEGDDILLVSINS